MVYNSGTLSINHENFLMGNITETARLVIIPSRVQIQNPQTPTEPKKAELSPHPPCLALPLSSTRKDICAWSLQI